MPDRHFYLLSHYICYSLFFLFSVCWLQRNERNSLWENKGERSEVYCLLGRYLCHGILFICSHITFPMIYSFYFLCFGFGRNAINLKVTTLISWKMTIRFRFSSAINLENSSGRISIRAIMPWILTRTW